MQAALSLQPRPFARGGLLALRCVNLYARTTPSSARGVHTKVCLLPVFVRHLEAPSPLVENSQSRLVARPSSQAMTPWASNGGWHQWGSIPGPHGLAA